MKQLLLLVAGVLSLQTAFTQHQFYVGVRQGGGYAGSMAKTRNLVFQEDYVWDGTQFVLTQTHSLTQVLHGAASSTRFELLYGFKRIRVGYQLDYLYFKAMRHISKITPPEQGTSGTYTGTISNTLYHFVGHALLVEVLAYEKGKFSISPNISVGYFSPVGAYRGAEYKGYFQAGAGIMFGYKVGPALLYLNPDYMLRYGKDKPFTNSSADPLYVYRIVHSAVLHIGARIELLQFVKSKSK